MVPPSLYLSCLVLLSVLWSANGQTPLLPIGPPAPPNTPTEVPSQPTLAEPSDAAPVPPSGNVPATTTPEAGALEIGKEVLEQRLKAVEANSALDEAVRGEVVQRYKEGIAQVDEAIRFRTAAKVYRDVIVSGPAETEKLTTELAGIQTTVLDSANPQKSLPPEVMDMKLPQLEQRLAAERASLSEFGAELTTISEQLVVEENSRAAQLQTDLQTARDALTKIDQELALLPEAPTGELDEARRSLLLARRQAQRAKIEMLEQEQLSREPRIALLSAKKDKLQAQITLQEQLLAVMETQANRLRQQMAEESRLTAEQAQTLAEGKGEAFKNMADEVAGLSAEHVQLTEKLTRLSDRRKAADDKLKTLTTKATNIKTQLSVNGPRGAYGQVLLDEQRSLPPKRFAFQRASALDLEMAEARARKFALDEEVTAANLAVAKSKADPGPPSDFDRLMEKKQQVLTNLRDSHRALIDGLDKLSQTEAKYASQLEDYRAFLTEKLFWYRSSSVLGLQTIQELPAAVGALLSPARTGELILAGERILKERYLIVALVALAVILLTVTRPRMIHTLEDLGVKVRKTSQDSYVHTLRALILTVALALPFALFVGYIGWELARVPASAVSTTWIYGVSDALLWLSVVSFVLAFLNEVARPRGLGERHFGWKAESMRRLQSDNRLIWWTYVPAYFVVLLTLNLGPVYFDSLGRVVFLVATLLLAMIARRLFNPKDGVFAGYVEQNTEGWLAKLSWLWYPLLVASPLVFAIMAISGYMLTALTLNYQFQLSATCVAAGPIVYGLTLRAFSINERKLALQRALEQWRHKREAAETTQDEIVDVDETKIDLKMVGDQTRALLRFIVSLGILVGIWLVWASAVPALRHLDDISAIGAMSWTDLLTGIVIAIATVVASRNLPGILEIAILRNLPIEQGNRTAIATLIGYIIFAIGFAAMFNTLDIDWSKFAWIAAALSVGLGFGLQEIVANFVCGIILLFERPIRVGDIVTVGEVTGIVSRIQIRATTITDWDRKEFVVPNKEFVTGTLMNWTLTNKINRIVIPVGLAYGSDTDKAREVLFSIVREHPSVSKDPAPLVTFEGFGDSSLTMILRCYLPSLDDRLETIHQLHTLIHKRFQEEGIEIPFPQRDLHLKTYPKDMVPGSNGNGGSGEARRDSSKSSESAAPN